MKETVALQTMEWGSQEKYSTKRRPVPTKSERAPVTLFAKEPGAILSGFWTTFHCSGQLKRRFIMPFVRRLTSVAALATLTLALFAQSPQPSSPPPPQQPQQQTCTDNGTYVNSKGETVKRPENCSAAPKGATAQCRDGSYSFSHSRSGACSHHGGIAKWL